MLAAGQRTTREALLALADPSPVAPDSPAQLADQGQ
jgi:hypothetical protein